MDYKVFQHRVIKKYVLNNGWVVVPVHYSHDPTKDASWADKARTAYVRQESWEREMEIDFSAAGGIKAYPNFKRGLHVRNDLVYNPMLPLCLCVDFNVGFMVWEIGQVVNGVPHVIDEIVRSPGSIPEMVREFRSRYPYHSAEVWVYGDATGRARSTHDQQSNYDLMQLEFRGYASSVNFKVPSQNPPVKARINCVNRMLTGEDGKVNIFIAEKCRELIKDFEMVLLDADGGILQRRNRDDPYSQRTHASDAVGYWLMWEWPILGLAEGETEYDRDLSRPLRVYGRIFGRI